jgi:beta-exotoxin I transport system permease protein
MNIFKHELKMHIKSTIIWTSALLFLVVIFSLGYPVFKQNIASLNLVLKSLPKGLKSILGINIIDLSTPLGVYGFMFMYITLVGAVQSMNLGLSILSLELRDKTADFLLSKPVKRISIVNAKTAAALVSLLVTNVIFFTVSKISLDVISSASYSFKIFGCLTLSLFLIQLFFLSLGMVISVFLNKLKSVVPLSLGIVFGFFIINMLNESLKGKSLSAFSPYAYFSTTSIFINQGFELKWLILNSILVVCFFTGAYLKYIKKDMPSV